ncbi:MAG: DUF935 family protein [Puniceicoccales bacterium]|jgi:phage gp29-like protein|nr:DUF935 family protein [Puniceicoccales bacterium]
MKKTPLKNKKPDTWYDAHGRPIRLTAAPSGAMSMGVRLKLNTWREQFNPLRGLTIAKAISLLEDYERGRMSDLQWTYYYVEQTDPDMIGLLEARLGRILEMNHNVGTEKDADKTLVDEQFACISEKLAKIDNLYDAIEHLAMAPFRGFAHCEKYFDAGGDVYHLEIVDQWNAIRDGFKGAWRYNPTARSCGYEELGSEMDMHPKNFLYRESRRPINRFGLIKHVRSSFSEKDWDAFNESVYIPSGVVIGPPDVAEDDEAAYEEAARKIAEGGSGYLPNGSNWQPNTPPHDARTFLDRLDFLTEKLVLAGTGGKLTMLTAPGSGTLAGSAHQKVFDQIASSEARRISETFNRQLVDSILDAEFPGQPKVAYFELAANEETDSGAAVTQVASLSQAGYQVDPDQVKEKTGWIVTLKPATAPVPSPGLPGLLNRETADPESSSELLRAMAKDFEPARDLVEKFLAKLEAGTATEADVPDLAAMFGTDATAAVLERGMLDAVAQGIKDSDLPALKNTDQDRQPAGSAEGGQFTGDGASASSPKSEDSKQALGTFYEQALADKNFKGTQSIAKVDSTEAARLEKATGLKFEGFERAVDADKIRHIDKRHGSATETLRGQVPITKADIQRIPEIVAKADIRLGGQTGRGLQTIEYKAKIGGTYYLYEEVRTGKKQLVPTSLYKMKNREGLHALCNALGKRPERPPVKTKSARTTKKVKS